MKPHKWAKEIKAWADGEKIQFMGFDEWVDIEDDEVPEWNKFSEYRIKPQPKEPQYLYVWLDKEMGEVVFDYEPPHIVKEDDVHKYIGKIKLEDESE
jgi:hypothetical protein